MFRDDFLDLFMALGAFLLMVAAISGFAFFLVFKGTAWDCLNYSRVTGLETRMAGLTCYVRENGRWLAYEERVYRNATRGQ